MIQDNNDQPMQLSSNPFIAQQQQREAELNQWGLDEFDDHWDRRMIIMEAEPRIHRENIIDKAEKRKVYEEVKAQYKEYLAYQANKKTVFQEMRQLLGIEQGKREDQDTSSKLAKNDESNKKQQSKDLTISPENAFAEKMASKEDNGTTEDITQNPEYIKGYQRCLEYEKEQEERNKTPYIKGWNAASEEIMRNKALAIEAELEQSEILLSSDLQESSVIKQLKEEIKQLDERLKKLEKYTEE